MPNREATTPSRAAIVFLLIWAPYAFLVARFWFVTEDAFISLRYARHWAEGHGLVFNLGEQPPVEGYSNFLWVALNALVARLGGQLDVWAPWLCFATGTALLWYFHRTLLRLGVGAWPAGLATLSLGCFPPFALWSSSGLETMPFALAFFVAFERAVLAARPAPVAAGIAGLALALLRTEGILWSVAIGVASFVSQRLAGEKGLRSLARYFAIVLIGFSIYFAWRYDYYGRPFANTAYAKGTTNAATLIRGVHYVVVFFLSLGTPLLVFVTGPYALLRRPVRHSIPVVVAVTGFVVYAVFISGDFMAMGRLLAPSFALYALLFAWWIDDICARARGLPLAIGVTAVVTSVALLPAWDRHVIPESVRARFHFRHNRSAYHSEYWVWKLQHDNHRSNKDLALALTTYAKPGDSLPLGVIGNVGYYTELIILDKHGLTNPRVAALEVTGALRSPGHDKSVSDTFFLDEQPTLLRADVVKKKHARKRLRKLEKACRKRPLDGLYVPDFKVLGDRWKQRSVLVLMHRLEDGATKQDAWADYKRRRDEALPDETGGDT